MSRADPRSRSTPDQGPTGRVLGALGDPVCRRILARLDEPMTGPALDDELDVSSSTLYRKLDRLTDCGLVETRIDIQADYSHSTRYAVAFDELTITLDDVRAASTPADDRD